MRVCVVAKASSASNLNEHVLATNFACEDFRALLFPAAGAIVQADAPAVPAANDFAFLNETFAQWKAEMGAKVLDGVNAALPLKQGNANAISFYGQSEAVGGEVSDSGHAYPFIHVRDDILRSLNFVRPSIETRSQDRS